MTTESLTVMVSGMVAGTPGQAGASWSVLQWVLGLKELGHRAILVEEIPPEAVTPEGASLAGSTNAAYLENFARELHLGDDFCLMVSGTRETSGMGYDEVLAAAGQADCLLNISGTLKDRRILDVVPVRAYVDVDPAFTQLWDLQGHDLGLEGHHHFLTVGLSIGSAGCPVPVLGRDWKTIFPPVALSHWPRVRQSPRRAFTTVVNWRGYGSIEHEGVFYGQKVHSFRKFFPLPAVTGEDFQLACALSPQEISDLEQLARYGWQLVDPARVAGDRVGYRDFLGSSLAEFNVAKSGYVVSRCGWFSDRSACYLACGRPVVTQDTGVPDWIPAGEGLLVFSTLEEAAAVVLEVKEGYARHSKAARLFAEEFLDSRKVVGEVLERVLR